MAPLLGQSPTSHPRLRSRPACWEPPMSRLRSRPACWEPPMPRLRSRPACWEPPVPRLRSRPACWEPPMPRLRSRPACWEPPVPRLRSRPACWEPPVRRLRSRPACWEPPMSRLRSRPACWELPMSRLRSRPACWKPPTLDYEAVLLVGAFFTSIAEPSGMGTGLGGRAPARSPASRVPHAPPPDHEPRRGSVTRTSLRHLLAHDGTASWSGNVMGAVGHANPKGALAEGSAPLGCKTEPRCGSTRCENDTRRHLIYSQASTPAASP